LPFGQQPLLLYGGGLTLQTSSGSVQAILLDTHSFMNNDQPTTIDQVLLLLQLLLIIIIIIKNLKRIVQSTAEKTKDQEKKEKRDMSSV